MHVYAATKVDDRVDSLKSVEVLPLQGTSVVDGQWTEITEDLLDEQISATRKAWKKAHPDAKKTDPGPFPYRTTVTLRRRGAAVPQTLVVRFADGSSETATWNDEERWKRFAWVKPVKAVSAELDPKNLHGVDVSRLDNSRSLESDRRASTRLGVDASGVVQALFALIGTL